MERKNDEFYRFLATQRDTIKEMVEPYWYRCTRYGLEFCFVSIYADDLDEKYFTCNMRKTDGCAILDDKFAYLIIEASDDQIIPGVLEKLVYNKEAYFHQANNHYYGAVVCSSQCEGIEDNIVNKSFMILEYAYEYNLSNQILTVDSLPKV